MTTRTEYGIRVHWADGRTHQPYTPTTDPDLAKHWADTWPYPTATAIVIQRDVTVGEWREMRRGEA